MPGSGQTFEELASRYEPWFATPLGVWAGRYEMDAVLRLLEICPGGQQHFPGAGAFLAFQASQSDKHSCSPAS